MKHIYIAGPYRGEHAWEVEQNIRDAEAVAFEVGVTGEVPVCPHTMFRYFNGTLTDQYWLAATQSLLLRCDIILLLPRWKESEGARGELAAATIAGIPHIHYSKWNESHRNWDMAISIQNAQTIAAHNISRASAAGVFDVEGNDLPDR